MRIWLLAIALSLGAGKAETLSSRLLAQKMAHTATDDRIAAAEQLLTNDGRKNTVKIELVSAYLQKVRESGDYSYLERAAKIVDLILANDTASVVAAHFQNEMDLQRHKFREVAARAQGMIQYDPSDAATWANLGDASMELGQYQQAGEAYLHMFALRPDLGSYNRLAYYRFVTGDAAGAISLMRTAIQAGSPQPENTAWCWAELGDMLFKTGQLDHSSQAYGSALTLFPRMHRALGGLGKVNAAQGRVTEAIESYRKAQNIVPLVDYAAALEDLYASAGRTAEAAEQRNLIDAIDQLGKANGEKTNRNLVIIYADHGRRLDRALELIEAELPVRGDVYTWDTAAWVFYKTGRLAEAKAASDRALLQKTPEPMFSAHAKRIAEALQASLSAREALPDGDVAPGRTGR